MGLRPPGFVHQEEVLTGLSVPAILSPQDGLPVDVDADEAGGPTGRDAGAAPEIYPGFTLIGRALTLLRSHWSRAS